MADKPYRTEFIDYDARRDPKTSHSCCRCQKDLKPGQKFRMVHWVDGGPFALHPEDEAVFAATPGTAGGDMGYFAVGMDCAKKIGLEWTHSSEGFPARNERAA